MEIVVIDGRLFFRLSTGERISCECIRDPYASQIARDFKATLDAAWAAVESAACDARTD